MPKEYRDLSQRSVSDAMVIMIENEKSGTIPRASIKSRLQLYSKFVEDDSIKSSLNILKKKNILNNKNGVWFLREKETV